MTTVRTLCIAFGSLGIGFGLGLYVQHRWPAGRWHDKATSRPEAASMSVAAIASIPADRRLVLFCVGQSNAANYGEPRGAAGAHVYALAKDRLYAARDPIPGGDGYGGSIWSRLGARLMATGRYDAVVFAVAARGSTFAADWAPDGKCHPQLLESLGALQAAHLPPDAILWQQGEQEARDPSVSGSVYAAAVKAVAAECRRFFPAVPFYVAQATSGDVVNQQISGAQTALRGQADLSAGADIDSLGSEFRRDGIHLNERGLHAAAELWYQVLMTRTGKGRT